MSVIIMKSKTRTLLQVIIKKILTCGVLCLAAGNLLAQNVGIGTPDPTKPLSVVGSILVDRNNQNFGTLDSAALLFGSGGTGIFSKKIGLGGVNDLNFATGNIQRMHISGAGNIGIGGPATAISKLNVYGSIYAQQSLTAIENSSIGGDIDPDYKLRVWGHTRLSTLETSTNIGVGIAVDNNYRLKVSGDTRLTGDLYGSGNVGFGGTIEGQYRLKVYGDTRLNGDLFTNGSMGLGTTPQPGYKLYVVGDHYLGGDFRTTGYAAIGGNIDPAYRLRVWNGNSRFGGDAEVTGSLSTSSLTIDGKGSVRSNGSSALRIGFNEKVVDVQIAANGQISVSANISEFSGNASDIRVFVSQVELNPGNTMFVSNVHVVVTDVDASTDTCTLVIRNLGNAAANLKATIYLTCVARD